MRLLVRLEGVGLMFGRSTTLMWHTAYENDDNQIRATLTDALNKLRAKGREDDVVVLQEYSEVRWLQGFTGKAITTSILGAPESCSSPSVSERQAKGVDLHPSWPVVDLAPCLRLRCPRQRAPLLCTYKMLRSIRACLCRMQRL